VQIEHVGLWARDLEEVCDFYVTHLGAHAGERYDNASKGFSSRFLTWDTSSARLEVMHHAGRDQAIEGTTGWAHIALTLGSEAAVDEVAERLREAAVPVVDGPRRTGDGYYECVVLDPEGNRVELMA
jgi:lactoylglutathione lyase